MTFLLDTVAIIRYFSGKGKIGKNAKNIFENFENSDDKFVISVISLMEIMYLSEKKRIDIDFEGTISLIKNSSKYQIIDLNVEILRTTTIDFYELHDRMLIATAIWLDIPIITNDSLISQIKELQVIWE
ncbi:MAG: PIN domain-containing protein [Candidatus Kapabacteria bacterium]|nr:PIN domain-containing protein [Candidatus Kapabacteria bacterium]